MSRAPFQVLILPYAVAPSGEILYCVFRRQMSDGGYWQAIAGGGEGSETPLEAARREAFEDAQITLSGEHVDSKWAEYDTARQMLKWDSNRTALWELNYRLRAGLGFQAPAYARRP
ncbi:MAG: NUDIX domain-containing protein [Clostridia bacterium]|nr:NUDIX domain-containing protein [Clostridia bacterium]